jgi:outer membrane receptor protein involved in Fe transport
MLRTLIVFILVFATVAQSADADVVLYKGRLVAEVIDEFRAAGYPFAYSTSLVRADLRVVSEPVATDPTAIVGEILAPHELTLRTEAGVLLVVRIDRSEAATGTILLVISARGSGEAVVDATLTVTPALPAADEHSSGVFHFRHVKPGRYQFKVSAEGFVASSRMVDIPPGENEVIRILLRAAKSEIETITVSASRYDISRDIASSRFLMDQRSIQDMPDIGEDPIRITQRLPGAAASGASAKTHFRGGTDGEIGVMLNGQWLFDPFHIRDYQSIFSAIDSRAISGVQVYTGGFPAQYGDRMSGMVLMKSMELTEQRHTEVGISVFNSSFLTSGSEGDLRWLFSARRGNLDLVINPKFGEPSYYDVFGELAIDLSPSATLTFNALYADDRVRVRIETKLDELEEVRSQTRNAQFWVQLENRWSESLSSNTVLSATSFDNLRNGVTNDIEKIVSMVRDDRQIDRFGIRQDWTWNPSEAHLLQWGLQAISSNAVYDYAGSADYFGLQALFENEPTSESRALAAAPQGGNFALYVSDRWRLAPKTIFEWGLRWDDQTYTNLSSDAQLSPRLNLLYALNPKTELRLTWGRYHQSQAIHELQIEDGVSNFWPAQRSDHVIAGMRHLFGDDYAVRIEAFHKDLSRITPRFENLFNPLGLIPELQPDRVRVDPSSAKSSGLEISVDSSKGDWSWWGSYTYSTVTDRIDGRSVPRSWDQRHAFQGGVSWTNDTWSAAAAASVHSGWPVTDLTFRQSGVDVDGEPVYVVVPGLRNQLSLPTFASLDLRLSRTFDVRRGSLMAFVEISNATNRRNICCHDWDINDDVANGFSLERSFDYWLPLLPAIGVLWEF